MDRFEQAGQDPKTLHRYLYASDDPVRYIDPSGCFTSEFGYAVEKEIAARYGDAYPDSDASYGEVFGFKPDILDHTRMKWMEIKPLSIGGIYKGTNQWVIYNLFYDPFGFTPDTHWSPGRITVDGVPVYVFNVDGVLFYTDIRQNLEELMSVTTMGQAYRLREWLRNQRYPSQIAPDPTLAYGLNVARNTSITSMVVVLAVVTLAFSLSVQGG